ncbi:MAG: hypothetical protein WAqPseu_34840 [Shewanella algae]
MNDNSNLKPFYVYELVDSRNNEVFYVGKGVGQRGNQHELEARGAENSSDKIKKINDIKQSGGEVIVRVIGRYKSEEQAFAVEATLIHWVYGLVNLTNIQSGHGSSTIRNFGDLTVLEGIDIPKAERRADGVYALAMREARDSNDILQFIGNVKSWLEEQLDIGFTKPDTSESNKTKIYSYFEQARIRIGAFHSKEPTLWLALEPADKTPEAKKRFLAVCETHNLKVTKDNKLARLPGYKGTKDLEILKSDILTVIGMLDG